MATGSAARFTVLIGTEFMEFDTIGQKSVANITGTRFRIYDDAFRAVRQICDVS